MRKTVYETNYDRLVKLGIIQEVDGKCKRVMRLGRSVSGGLMDLSVERVPQHDEDSPNKEAMAISLAHYFKQNGDLCRDPEMVIFVYPSMKMVEAGIFQQDLPPIYQEVFADGGTKVRSYLKKELNKFLRQWLNNLIEQQHGKNWTTKPRSAA